jgi:hypothetical protein
MERLLDTLMPILGHAPEDTAIVARLTEMNQEAADQIVAMAKEITRDDQYWPPPAVLARMEFPCASALGQVVAEHAPGEKELAAALAEKALRASRTLTGKASDGTAGDEAPAQKPTVPEWLSSLKPTLAQMELKMQTAQWCVEARDKGKAVLSAYRKAEAVRRHFLEERTFANVRLKDVWDVAVKHGDRSPDDPEFRTQVRQALERCHLDTSEFQQLEAECNTVPAFTEELTGIRGTTVTFVNIYEESVRQKFVPRMSTAVDQGSEALRKIEDLNASVEDLLRERLLQDAG